MRRTAWLKMAEDGHLKSTDNCVRWIEFRDAGVAASDPAEDADLFGIGELSLIHI